MQAASSSSIQPRKSLPKLPAGCKLVSLSLPARAGSVAAGASGGGRAPGRARERGRARARARAEWRARGARGARGALAHLEARSKLV